jgi:hypothetical protein
MNWTRCKACDRGSTVLEYASNDGCCPWCNVPDDRWDHEGKESSQRRSEENKPIGQRVFFDDEN